MNVPVVTVALAAGSFPSPEFRVPGRSRIDPPGVLLSTVGLAYLVYGIIRALDRE